MTEYTVSWEIDLDAESPLEAAREALAIHRDPESLATVFRVGDQHLDATSGEILPSGQEPSHPLMTVLTIKQKHETNASIHLTPEGARAELSRYVRTYWSDVAGIGDAPETAPEDDEEAIDIYFEEHDEESYILIDGIRPRD